MSEIRLVLSLVILSSCAVDDSDAGGPAPQLMSEQALAAEMGPIDDTLRAIVESRTEFRVAPEVELTEDAEQEAWELRYRFARALQGAMGAEALLARSGDPEVVTIEYLGKGVIGDGPNGEQPGSGDESPTVPEYMNDGARWLDGFSVETQNEYRVRIPKDFSRAVGDQAVLDGINLGSGDIDAENVPRGFSDGTDNRVMLGSLNTAHTNANYKKLVSINSSSSGGCSGALVGPKHTLTAGHCVWNWTGANTGSWSTGTLRAGRNGTAWHADATISSDRYYWVPSQYRASATDPAFSVWDIGVFVTHSGRMGEDPDVGGWFGWWWTSSNTSFETYLKNLRGYPACGLSLPPTNCQQNHLYGDTNFCSVGGYSSATDSAGVSMRFKHSCDTSAAMSGAAIYEFNAAENAVVVTGVHTGYDGTAGSTPNYATRITRDYSDDISWLRTTYP
jgi:V8-like Glu-specific endopeptidase